MTTRLSTRPTPTRSTYAGSILLVPEELVDEGQLQEELGVAKSSSAAYYKVREQPRSLGHDDANS